jgi:hypothetical protein
MARSERPAMVDLGFLLAVPPDRSVFRVALNVRVRRLDVVWGGLVALGVLGLVVALETRERRPRLDLSGSVVDLPRRAKAGLEGTLDPGVVQ